VSPEYVYLLRVVVLTKEELYPKANIPIVAFPDADPDQDAIDAEVADETTQPE